MNRASSRARLGLGQLAREGRRPPRRFIRLLGALLIAAATGCSGDSEPRPPIGDAVELESGPALGLVEELRIGSLDDPDYGFSGIAGLDVSDGEIFVCDRLPSQLRVYAPDGRLLRRIGRQGEGPDEYRTCGRFGVLGDTVWVVHSPFITLFDRAGRLLSSRRYEVVTIPWHHEGETARLSPYEMEPSGLFRSRAVSRGVSAAGPVQVARVVIEVPIIRFAPEGHVVDTVGWTESVGPEKRDWVRVGNFEFPVPRTPPTQWNLAETAEGRVVAEWPQSTEQPGVFHIRWHDLSGSVVRFRTYRARAIPHTDGMLDEIAASAAQMKSPMFPFPPGASEEPSPAEVARARAEIRAAIDYPPYMSPIGRSHAGEDGSLWVEVVEQDQESPTSHWVVLDPEGEVRGGVELPRASLRILRLHGDEVWASVADDFGVPWLVRYRLVPEERSLQD